MCAPPIPWPFKPRLSIKAPAPEQPPARGFFQMQPRRRRVHRLRIAAQLQQLLDGFAAGFRFVVAQNFQREGRLRHDQLAQTGFSIGELHFVARKLVAVAVAVEGDERMKIGGAIAAFKIVSVEAARAGVAPQRAADRTGNAARPFKVSQPVFSARNAPASARAPRRPRPFCRRRRVARRSLFRGV